ncbi:MAG: TetR family transcriptional regulator [Planctomycetes bacterium]|nr:TetR family transcriptional regulator [Planctomycetota bacterium]NBY01278.1 TetR family transcriptional regulator [Planctomycetota bacterium]
MNQSRIDISFIRKEQIVDAAVCVIAQQGLQNFSLSEIEKKANMSRGQLTYYFPAKEDILLAVFDRFLFLMQLDFQVQDKKTGKPSTDQLEGWDRISRIIENVLVRPVEGDGFHALQYTFLSQISHRADFRLRLSALYEEWRIKITTDLKREFAPVANDSDLRNLATLIEAVLHGLSMQRAADPDAFDPKAMCDLVVKILFTYMKSKFGQNKQIVKKKRSEGV